MHNASTNISEQFQSSLVFFLNDTANKYCELTFLLTLPTENDIQIICAQLETGEPQTKLCMELRTIKN